MEVDVEAMKAGFKRWAPIVGVAVLVLSAVLKVLGQTQLADIVDLIGGATGISTQSPVSGVEVTAAVAALMGLTLKIMAVIRKQ